VVRHRRADAVATAEGCVVVMQTCWSQNDLVGSILERPDADTWTRLTLPGAQRG
jgi:hypothetical protein